MKNIDEVIHKVFDSYLSTDAHKNLEVLRSWQGIAGVYAEHCEPIDLKNGNLVIAIDHPGSLTKFKFKEAEFLREVKKRHPNLKIKKFVYVFDKKKYAKFTEASKELEEQKAQNRPEKPAESGQNPIVTEKTDGKPEFLAIVENIKRHLK